MVEVFEKRGDRFYIKGSKDDIEVLPDLISFLKPIDDLKVDPANPRKTKLLDSLVAGINRFGIRWPIMVNKRTGIIEAGHQRLYAAREMGLTHWPVILADDDNLTAAGFNVSDNRLGEVVAEWDDDVLAVQLQAMLKEDADAIKGIGFEREEADLLISLYMDKQKGEGGEDPGPGDPPVDPLTKYGDLWTMGDHRLLCGDSTNARDIERACEGGRISVVIADPPYGINERTDRATAGRGKLAKNKDFRPVHGDDVLFDPTPWIEYGEVVLWGANHYCSRLPSTSCWFVWDKRGGVGSDDNADCEIAWTNLNGPARLFSHLWKGCIKASEHGIQREHPTQKPIVLMEWCIGKVGESEFIFDPFAGSGVVLIAAEKLNRRCFCLEIDPTYCDVICQRYYDLTSVSPIRESDGAEWVDVAVKQDVEKKDPRKRKVVER